MKRWLSLVFFLLGCMNAWSAGPSIKVALEARQPILVGQQVHMQVTVTVPNFFKSAPPFPPLAVPGAIVTMPDERGQNSSQTVGGVTYASITKTYIFSAQQEGEFQLPPTEVTFSYADDEGKPRQAKLKMPPFKISAKLPPGAAAAASAAGGAIVPVARVQIHQTFDRTGVAFHVGEALVRSIDITVDHTQAMMIPPPEAEAPNGVRVFAADPVLRDETRDRQGLVAGHRSDRLTYVFEKTGSFTLPAVQVTWFDAAAGKSRIAEAPALVVKVEPGPPSPGAIAPEAAASAASTKPSRHASRWRTVNVLKALMALVVAALVLLWGGRWFKRRLPGWRARQAARRAALATAEPSLFAAVQEAASKSGAGAVHAAALVWSRHTGQGMSSWVASRGDAALSEAWGVLQSAAWASQPQPGWNAGAFIAAFTRSRADWRHAATAQKGTEALPTLNP